MKPVETYRQFLITFWSKVSMQVIAPVEAFGKKCQHLAQFPYLGRSYSQLAPSLRGVPLMGYIIFYQIVENEDKIEILRVISGYRNLKNIFTRRLNGRSAIAPPSFPRYTISPGIEAIPHQSAMEAYPGKHITAQKTPFDTAN